MSAGGYEDARASIETCGCAYLPWSYEECASPQAMVKFEHTSTRNPVRILGKRRFGTSRPNPTSSGCAPGPSGHLSAFPTVSFSRRHPSAVTLGWVERSLGGGARVTAARRMAGGIASVVHRLTIEQGSGRDVLVLRQY